MQSQVQTILELIKSRLAVVAIGFAAHFARVLALAPILGGMVMALIMAMFITPVGERLEWLMGPMFGAILPESLQEDFSGGLMEFGLPIAFKHVGLGFWICIILSVVEQFTGTGWRRRFFALKYWAAGFGVYFLLVAVFLFFFHQINGTFWEGVLVFSVLNGVLYVATLGGLVGFKIIGFVENGFVEKFSGDGETQEDI